VALRLADSGCCQGHACDDCRTCSSGRCCRKDNPQYRLPKLGDWQGPVFGALGKIESDGDRIVCHACGSAYKGLGGHIWFAHDLTGDEYKRLFGLKLTSSLTGESVVERIFAGQDWRQNKNDPRLARSLSALRSHDRTPEQKSRDAVELVNYELARKAALGESLHWHGKTANLRPNPPKPRACSWCGSPTKNAQQRTCSPECLRSFRRRARTPEHRAAMSAAMTARYQRLRESGPHE
jgi:hypothetical protein